MRYKVVDVKTETEENVQFGTCELCMSVGSLTRETIVIEDSQGESYDIETGQWDWGDYITSLYIDNVADFSAWLSKQDIQEYMDFDCLYSLVVEYDNYKEDTK